MEPILAPPNPFVDESGALAMPALVEWFVLPGDWAIYLLASRLPPIAELLDVGPADYGSTFSGILSWALWMSFAIASIVGVHAVRQFDRAVTSKIAYWGSELRRRARMAVVLARYRRSLRAVRKEPTIIVEETPPSTR
jgi:hypothetical protein